jgi:histone-lysine N-methyltransferase ASH1L
MSVDQLIGDAQQIWRKERSSTNKCVCTTECDESCLNRVTWVECTDSICPIGRHCGNRAFADLQDRKNLGTSFAIGVEVELVRAYKRKYRYA